MSFRYVTIALILIDYVLFVSLLLGGMGIVVHHQNYLKFLFFFFFVAAIKFYTADISAYHRKKNHDI